MRWLQSIFPDLSETDAIDLHEKILATINDQLLVAREMQQRGFLSFPDPRPHATVAAIRPSTGIEEETPNALIENMFCDGGRISVVRGSIERDILFADSQSYHKAKALLLPLVSPYGQELAASVALQPYFASTMDACAIIRLGNNVLMRCREPNRLYPTLNYPVFPGRAVLAEESLESAFSSLVQDALPDTPVDWQRDWRILQDAEFMRPNVTFAKFGVDVKTMSTAQVRKQGGELYVWVPIEALKNVSADGRSAWLLHKHFDQLGLEPDDYLTLYKTTVALCHML